VRHAGERQDLHRHVLTLQDAAGDAGGRDFITGPSTALKDVLETVHKVAKLSATVLILGESGTGKELLARAMHKASPRRARPFVVIRCTGMPEDQLDMELFGAAASTGKERKGGLEQADGGTALLDEIGELPPRLQQKLLRALQEDAVRPAGSDTPHPIHTRVISTASRDLQDSTATGHFREELYYRLNVVQIEMPPLARRREDIPLLIAHFLAQIATETGQRSIFPPEALELLATADWPGNVRQLQNLVRQAVALSQTPIVPVELVQQSLGGAPGRLPSFDEARDEFTRGYLSQILQITGGNVSQAARLARRNRTDFYKLLGRHQLVPEDFKQR
jgi:two-component system response regulator GlrR